MRRILRSFLGLPLPLAWLFVVLLNLAAIYGASKLNFDDELVRAFKSETRHYQAYEKFSERFPHQGRDILILLEAKSFADIDRMRAVEDLILDMHLLDGVEDVISIYSLPNNRQARLSRPEQSESSPNNERIRIWLRKLRQENPIGKRFVSEDFGELLVIARLSKTGFSDTDGMIEKLSRASEKVLKGTGISMNLTGYQVLRSVVKSRLLYDFGILVGVGAVCGALISIIVLRSVLLGGMVAFSAGTALLWILGALGMLGVSINVMTVALPVLVLILSFADSLHIAFETLKQRSTGRQHETADALERIAPACLIASTTTAIAFAVLAFSPSELIAQLGRAGVVSTFLAVAAVLIVQPLLFQSLDKMLPDHQSSLQAVKHPGYVTVFFRLVGFALRRSRMIAVSSISFTVISTAIFFWAPANFSLFETLQADDPSLMTLKRINKELSPTGAIHFQVRKQQKDAKDFVKAQQFLESITKGAVMSFATFEKMFAPGEVPAELGKLFYSQDGDMALLSSVFRYEDARQTRLLVNRIEAEIAAKPELQKIFTEKATGLEVMTSFVIVDMLNSLTLGFLIAAAASGILIAFWFRDPVIGILALIPNLLPITFIGAWLTVTDRGLEFSSGIALTIAFGLAVDDTAHVLNRLKLNRANADRLSKTTIANSVEKALPALVVTSTVLSFGLLGTLFASLPTVTDFGVLCIAAFALALLADLVVLPACLSVLAVARKQAR